MFENNKNVSVTTTSTAVEAVAQTAFSLIVPAK